MVSGERDESWQATGWHGQCFYGSATRPNLGGGGQHDLVSQVPNFAAVEMYSVLYLPLVGVPARAPALWLCSVCRGAQRLATKQQAKSCTAAATPTATKLHKVMTATTEQQQHSTGVAPVNTRCSRRERD